MSEREWKPKVGDKVKVTGCETLPFFATINRVGPVDGWYLINHDRAYSPISAHIRNLDPVLEDERRGAPRPKPREGEPVELVLPGRICAREYATPPFLRLRAEPEYGALEVGDPRVRQIERRKQNMGREARKS